MVDDRDSAEREVVVKKVWRDFDHHDRGKEAGEGDRHSAQQQPLGRLGGPVGLAYKEEGRVVHHRVIAQGNDAVPPQVERQPRRADNHPGDYRVVEEIPVDPDLVLHGRGLDLCESAVADDVSEDSNG